MLSLRIGRSAVPISIFSQFPSFFMVPSFGINFACKKEIEHKEICLKFLTSSKSGSRASYLGSDHDRGPEFESRYGKDGELS